jgi:thiosulfate dehydrogenase (quinone) large subunit
VNLNFRSDINDWDNLKNKIMKNNYSNGQVVSLTFLRVLIGWHFLYEGLVKLYNPVWSSKSYLSGAIGPLAPIFKSMANNDSVITLVDLLNEWGLILIGLSLFIGLFSNAAKISGMILLLFYYLSYPPFAQFGYNGHVEGSYWVVNKNLIEMASIIVLYLFPTSHITGLDRFFFKVQERIKILRVET